MANNLSEAEKFSLATFLTAILTPGEDRGALIGFITTLTEPHCDLQCRQAAYLIFRDAERQDRASVLQCSDLSKNQWTATDLTTNTVGNWEPSYDTERWKSTGILSLFVQRTGQGDGETLENLAPQPVYILEWKPGQSIKSKATGK